MTSHSHYTPRADIERAASTLIRGILEGFSLHPYFFMLKESMRSEDPVYPFAHQVELLAKLMARRPIRVLVGDEIGLGKTVVAIMILKYLMGVGEVKKALILLPRVLVEQWLGELGRFGLTSVCRLERSTFNKYAGGGFPDCIYVASMDWAKREKYRNAIVSAEWDLVVVDEAHRVGRAGYYETLRRELVKRLVEKPKVNVLFLTATPHRGKAEDYLERVKLLDPHLTENVGLLDTREFYSAIFNALVFRRTKRDVNEIYEGRRVFKDCKFKARLVSASSVEKAFHNKLIWFLKRKLEEHYSRGESEQRAFPLLLTIIAKRASSSPRAAMLTLNNIIARRAGAPKDSEELEREAERIVDSYLGYSLEDIGIYVDEGDLDVDEPDEALNSFAEKCSVFLSKDDVSELRELHEMARDVAGDGDSRLKALTNIVTGHLKRGERIVVFTEYADTARYVHEELSRRLGGYKVALATSREIILPGFSSRPGRRPTIEDVKSWLRRGRIDVIVSTDFASEGLNLQYANVVVHYEPTWSPVKIVQRIGRVWRVGQSRDVYSYSILLDVESDVSVLQILYAKLLAWLISGMTRDIIIGEELEIDMLAGNSSSTLHAPLSAERGGLEYSEYRAIIEFLEGRLDRYISIIIATLAKLREEAENALRAEDIHIHVKRVLYDVLGNMHGSEAEGALRELFISLAELSGYEVEVRDDRVFAGMKYVGLRDARDFYAALEKLASKGDVTPVALIVEGGSLGRGATLLLYNVKVNVKGRPCYSEAAGLLVHSDGSMEEVRGARLLKLLSSSLKRIIGFTSSVHGVSPHMAENIKSRLLRFYPDHVISRFIRYMEKVEEKKYSGKHEHWEPRSLSDVSISAEPIAVILALTPGKEGAPPPALVEEVERRAMEFAMDYERSQGREPEDVSKKEHYDIKSYDPKTSETLYIEVKGSWRFNVSVELTSEEFKLGEKLRDKHWLYIVLGISTGEPILLRFRDPVHRLKWLPQIKSFRLTGFSREEAENARA